MTTTVANIRDLPNDWQSDNQYVYVGRANRRYGVAASPFANPFPLPREAERDQVCDRYAEWISDQPELLAKVSELKGKVLVCWCAPKRCHANYLAELADKESEM